MSDATELIRAVMGEHCRSAADAEAILEAARAAGADALDFCAHRFGIGEAAVFERAADWANLAFSPVVPSMGACSIPVQRLGALADVRSVRETLFDREVTFVAPRFEQMANLRAYVRKYPKVRRSLCVTPASAIRAALARTSAPQLLDEARQRLARRWPFASADLDLGRPVRLSFVCIAAALVLLAALASGMLQVLLLPLVGAVLIVPGFFRLVAVVTASERPPPAATPPMLADRDLPVYTVLIPLYDEAQMVPLLGRVMTALDYPSEKLDIKFVVESRSTATIAAVRALLGDPRFELVPVPDAPPFTKPKALDYALPLVRGAHVVVFDAEDIPDSDQLRLAAATFAANLDVDCLQAELLVDNARENILTGLFTGEYAGQFGIMLPALARWGLPMPLGGTSNHFRTRALLELGGWDAFNVTEDADLGVRLARLRYRAATLASRTYEEAPVTLGIWLAQRTRWMKGWMQTFIVHNRRPARLWRDIGWRGFLAFEIYVGSMILSPLLHTVFLIGLMVTLARHGAPRISLGSPCLLAELTMLLIGYGGSVALGASGLLRLGQHRLLAQQLLLPCYWVLHGIATVWAAYQLVTRPHFWAKTQHGLTRLERSFDSPRGAGRDLVPGSASARAPRLAFDAGVGVEFGDARPAAPTAVLADKGETTGPRGSSVTPTM